MATTGTMLRNGVDTAQLVGTFDALKADPTLARFQFRARNRWLGGAHDQTSTATSSRRTRRTRRVRTRSSSMRGEPAILLGTDTGPNPAECLLHALAACLTTSIVYVAAARSVE